MGHIVYKCYIYAKYLEYIQNIYSIWKSCIFSNGIDEKNRSNDVTGTFDEVENVPDVNFNFFGHHIYESRSMFICRMLRSLPYSFESITKKLGK